MDGCAGPVQSQLQFYKKFEVGARGLRRIGALVRAPVQFFLKIEVAYYAPVQACSKACNGTVKL